MLTKSAIELEWNTCSLIDCKRCNDCFMLLVGCVQVLCCLLNRFVFVLSHADVVRHYHIKCDEYKKFYISDRHRFDEISQLVEYHQHNGGGQALKIA